jgi:MoxR-like ATPase
MKPEQIVGCMNILKMKEGILEINSSGYLPECPVGFHDEIGRGETVLDLLLPLINEGYFKSNGKTVYRKRLCDIAFSNTELLDSHLEALNDRFPIKFFGQGIQSWENTENMLYNQKEISDLIPTPDLMVSFEEIEAVQLHVKNALETGSMFNDAMKEMFRDIVQEIRTVLQLHISSRTLKSAIAIVTAYAILNEKTMVDSDCFEVLKYCLVPEKKHAKEITKIVNRFANAELDLITNNTDDVIITHSDWEKAIQNRQEIDHRKIAERIKMVKHALDSMNVSDRNKVVYEQSKRLVEERYKDVLRFAMKQIQRV